MKKLESIPENKLQNVKGGWEWFDNAMGHIMWVAMGCPPGYKKTTTTTPPPAK